MTAKDEKNKDGKRTENSEIPKIDVQKCNNISYNGGLLPVLNTAIICGIDNCE